MNRRNLMIECDNLQQLKIDGPALCLQVRGKSRQWFPLRRIASIICVQFPSVGLRALAQAAHQGIPVNIFDRKGRLLVQMIHPGTLPSSFGHWIEAIPHDPALGRTYDAWLENQLRHTYGMIGCVTCNSGNSAMAAREQLAKLTKRNQCDALIKEARDWFEGLLTAQLQVHAARLGLSPSSLHLARMTGDLLEAGVLLCLTIVAANAKNSRLLSERRVQRFHECHLAPKVDQWIARALHTLANQLEQTAMLHDQPPR